MPFSNVTSACTGIKAPCCRYKVSLGEKAQLKNISLSETLNSEVFKGIQSKMLQGESLAGCQRCYGEEELGNLSYRQKNNRKAFQNYGEQYIDQRSRQPELNSIELGFSRECNLRCLMCSPDESNCWDSVWDIYYDKFQQSNLLANSVLLEGVDLTKIHFYKIVGGEPFMAQKFFDFLVSLKASVNLSQISMVISTNCTIFPKSKCLDILRLLGGLRVELSVDAIGPVNDYIRRNSKWSKVEKCAKKWVELAGRDKNIQISIHQTVTVYNAHIIGAVRGWAKDLGVKHIYAALINPSHLAFKILPGQYLEWACEQNINMGMDKNGIRKFLESEFSPPELKALKRFTDAYDAHDGFSLKKCLPRLAEVIENRED